MATEKENINLNKPQKKSISIVALVLTACMCMVFVNGKANAADDTNNLNSHVSTNIVSIDALGRTVNGVSGYEKDKYVGLFYLTWLGYVGTNKVFDITKLLRDDPTSLWNTDAKNIVAPVNAAYFFNEPLYGYYNSADPWVIRKHIELFIAADIDFLAIDCTNAVVYEKVWTTLLDLLEEYRLAGWHVPQVTFFTNTKSGDVVKFLYENIYSKNLYPELWFKGSYDKPLMIAWDDQMTQAQRDFFHVRPPQWPEADFNENGFPYVEKIRPQRLYTDLISVSVAQHVGGAFSWSKKGPQGKVKESWGRGYTTNNPINGQVDKIVSGANIQEQWDYAISVDPEIVFVTGWNEWVAGKFVNKDDFANYGKKPYWVDTFNTEFSRDIEMTKSSGYTLDDNGNYIGEGYGDNFYLQLIANVRKYKGISSTSENFTNPVSQTIDINASTSQWDTIKNVYLNLATEKNSRNFIGFADRTRYKQAAPNNFIKQIRVTHDKENMYFYVETDENITPRESEKTNWMNIFIGISGSKNPAWENYQFVINRKPVSDTITTLEKSTGGFNFETVAEIEYSVQGQVMQLKIPRSALNISSNTFSVYFKAADSIETENDIMNYYVSGESMPLGRLSYEYTVKSGGISALISGVSALEVGLIAFAAIAISACLVVLIKTSRKSKMNNIK